VERDLDIEQKERKGGRGNKGTQRGYDNPRARGSVKDHFRHIKGRGKREKALIFSEKRAKELVKTSVEARTNVQIRVGGEIILSFLLRRNGRGYGAKLQIDIG